MALRRRRVGRSGTAAGNVGRSWLHQFILTMRDLRRVHPPDKEVLRGINISMYPGAKIGVLGSNGSGKSTLLRIMAGEDDGYSGEVPGHARASRVGFLPQEPQLDATKDVLGNVTDGVAHTKGLLDRFEEVCNAMGEPDADFDKLLAEQAELQDRDRRGERLGPRPPARDRDGRAAAAALRRRRRDAVGRRAAPRRAVPAPAVEARPAAARRADEPPRRRVGRVARAAPAGVPRHRRRGHPRPLLPRQRRGLDPRARPRARHPVGGQLLVAGSSRRTQRLAQEEKVDEARRRTLARELEWIRMAPRARQAKGKARITAYEQLVAEAGVGRARARTKLQISIPPGPRLGDLVVEADKLREGLRRPAAHRRPLVLAAARRHRRRRSAPNGAGKTTLFRMLVGQETARRRRAEGRADRSSSRTSTSRASRSTATRPSTRRSPAASTTSRSATARSTAARTSPGFNFKGSDQQKHVGDLSGGERNRLHLAKALLMGGNVLLLDEPTNDLDVDTLRALEEALLAFPGCAVVISHDRWFLDRIATHVLAFEGDSEVRVVRGQLLRLRGRPAQAPRRRRRPAAPHQVQEAHATDRRRCRSGTRGCRCQCAFDASGARRARRIVTTVEWSTRCYDRG